jgi:uncharacterized pyridoxamine 5'-phosphate oxidase family protein
VKDKLDKIQINQLLNELENLTTSMNIPISKRKDYHWIILNGVIVNEGNRNLDKALKICKVLAKEETK